MGFNIAIDGPAGSGKSTIAKLAASHPVPTYMDSIMLRSLKKIKKLLERLRKRQKFPFVISTVSAMYI